MPKRKPYLPTGHKWGWDRENEDREWLESAASDPSEFVLFSAVSQLRTVPDIVPLIRNQSQRQWPSCRGHSLSNCIEWLYMLDRDDPYIEFSRQWCWTQTQVLTWGRANRNQGATMSHGIKLAMEQGVCEESAWPYPYPRYESRPPRGAKENAAKWKIRKFFRVRSYEEGTSFLATGNGAIDWGIRWKSSMSRAGRTVESFAGRGGWGHAVCCLALSPRTDRNGEHYWWMVNSHGASWGNRGSTEISPTCIRQVLRDSYTDAFAVTDLTAPRPRPNKLMMI